MQILNGFKWENENSESEEKRVPLIIKKRLPGGEFFNNIINDISSKSGFGRLMFDVLIYFAGRSFSISAFPKMKVEKLGEYTADGYLYHITPVSNIEKIRQEGIVSKKNYIFLIDDVESFIKVNEYLNWKSTQLNSDTEFCVLKINVSELRKRRRIYCINREHEYVTKKVEPEFILFD